MIDYRTINSIIEGDTQGKTTPSLFAFRCRLFTLSQRTLLPPAAQADAAKVQLASRRPTGLAAARTDASAADSHD
jgi:hypothetical protein